MILYLNISVKRFGTQLPIRIIKLAYNFWYIFYDNDEEDMHTGKNKRLFSI